MSRLLLVTLVLLFKVPLLAASYNLEKASLSYSKFPDSFSTDISGDRRFLEDMYFCPAADVLKFTNGAEVAVCGWLSAEPSIPNAFKINIGTASDLAFVVSKDVHGFTQLISIDGGWGGNPTFLKLSDDFEILHIEAISDNSIYHPVFATPISCSTGSCVVDKKICVNQIPKTIYADVTNRVKSEKIKRFRDVPDNGDKTMFYMDLVTTYSTELLLRALTGDKQAKALLLNPPFELDGGVSELWHADIDTFLKAKQLNCVQRR